MSLRAIHYERRLKYKSAFILQKIDPYEMVLVNSLRTLQREDERMFSLKSRAGVSLLVPDTGFVFVLS